MSSVISTIPNRTLFYTLVKDQLEGVPGIYDVMMLDYGFDARFCNIFQEVLTWKLTLFEWASGSEWYYNLFKEKSTVKPVKYVFEQLEDCKQFKACGWYGNNIFITRNLEDTKYVYLCWKSRSYSSDIFLILHTVYNWYNHGLYLGHNVYHHYEKNY